MVGVRAYRETTEVDRVADSIDHHVDKTIPPLFEVSDSEKELLNMVGEEGRMERGTDSCSASVSMVPFACYKGSRDYVRLRINEV
jgi:hypothetical protein